MALGAIRHAPITANEFAGMFRKCTPPGGWPRNIGVATSGGPDSSCLLFLIHRHLSEERLKSERPRQVFSLTVDHALQPTSAAMAEHCSKFARRLGIKHVMSIIDWEEPPMAGKRFEAVARAARYRALYAMMTKNKIASLAFGHHIDDQVETSLLRLSWGSTNLGAAGMKYCRRWGMGLVKGASSEYGLPGLNRWIVRPLLDVSKFFTISKDRILATCEANDIQYVVDPTNSQPAITLRNAIRHEIQANIHNDPSTSLSTLPEDIVKRLMTLESSARSLSEFPMSLDSSIEELRSGIRALSQHVRDIDDMVDSVIRSCSVPTLPGTFLFTKMALERVENPDVRRALVLRVMRYVSPLPWGSLNADAGRRRDSISRIVDQLWTRAAGIPGSFTTGASVLWTPVIIRDDSIKLLEVGTNMPVLKDDVPGWIASRLPPPRQEKLQLLGLSNTLHFDVTRIIVYAYKNWRRGGRSTLPVLYDSRFLVEFYLDKMPQDLVSRVIDDPPKEYQPGLVLAPLRRWFTPIVVFEKGREFVTTIHNTISEEPTTNLPYNTRRQYRKNDLGAEIDSGWIKIQWIRPLTAL